MEFYEQISVLNFSHAEKQFKGMPNFNSYQKQKGHRFVTNTMSRALTLPQSFAAPAAEPHAFSKNTGNLFFAK